MNVLFDAWLSIKTREGTAKQISPMEIGSRPKEVVSGIWEVDVGSVLLLIALAQTYLAPEDLDEWFDMFHAPPSPEEFERRVREDAHLFELFGEGPRFMQVPPSRRGDVVQDKHIKTLDDLLTTEYSHNRSFAFIFGPRAQWEEKSLRRENIPPLLYFFNTTTYSKQCGNGSVTIRGNGAPLFILEGRDLWETVWLNVIPEKTMTSLYNNEPVPPFEYPWTLKDSKPFYDASEEHPLLSYWFVTRDMFIPEGDTIHHVYSTPIDSKKRGREGSKWEQAWPHPLTVRNRIVETKSKGSRGKKEELQHAKAFEHANAGDWTFMRYGIIHRSKKDEVSSLVPKPALNILQIEKMARDLGLDADNIPVRVISLITTTHGSGIKGVVDRKVPLLTVDENIRPLMVEAVRGSVEIINNIESSLRTACKVASPSVSTPPFWGTVERHFYSYLRNIRDVADTSMDVDKELSVYDTFSAEVRRHALQTFDIVAQTDRIHLKSHAEAARIFKARNILVSAIKKEVRGGRPKIA